MDPPRPPHRDRPTTRPGRVPTRNDPDSSPPPSSDDREKVLREIRDVEERGKRALERSHAELTRLYENLLAQRDETIRALQNQLLQATSADGTINVTLTQFRQELTQLRAEMAAVALSVNKEQATDQIKEAKSVAKGEARHAQVRALVGAILTAIATSGIIGVIAQSCSEPSKKVDVGSASKPPQANPNNPHGLPNP